VHDKNLLKELMMQAVILAAGMGRRLRELTKDHTKCMVEVNGQTLIERILRQLDLLNLTQITLVVGYHGEKLVNYIRQLPIKTTIQFVDNPIYDKTNNIYSLYLAKDLLLQDDTLVLESDLIIADGILEQLVESEHPNLVLVAKYRSWMDGTVVTLDEDQNITAFIDKVKFRFCDIQQYYKTVNIYRFSKSFSQTHYVPFLEAYCKALGNNEYYEQVLKVIALLDEPKIRALVLDTEKWYEIDDRQDLDIAESLFEDDQEARYDAICARYGGYWRYPYLLDFCYLVNPYYPPPRLIEEMQASFNTLIREYPSGQQVNNLLMANYYALAPEQVLVGNGAAELIKALTDASTGLIGLISPSFEEYRNRIDEHRQCIYTPESGDFSYSAKDIMHFFQDKDISSLILVNPDNPSGNCIPYSDILTLADWAEDKNCTLVVDESFSDFADPKILSSLLAPEVLAQYPHVLVMKSISKSFGVPGIRLGLLASSNSELLSHIHKELAIWNINSFGEFYLQIMEKYRSDYQQSIVAIQEERAFLAYELQQIPALQVLPSEANYLMCAVTGKLSAKQLCVQLLHSYEILVKDLSQKRGIHPKQYVRISVRNREDNMRLILAMKEIYEQ
jgi:histidinol-phosphate/aromatic aminotransferase/cobyric acid decarboxylase-like protein/choline kinase